MEETKESYCQSCGMPMAVAKEENFGTNADGSKTSEFCSYCYQKGAFTEPDITMEKMIETAAKGWADHDPNVSYEEALAVAKKNIPTLTRWK